VLSEDLAWPVKVISNGIDPKVFHDDGRERPVASFAAVGRLVSDKGFGLLLNAFAASLPQLGDATLTIVGDGPDRAELEERAAALAGRVTFLGTLSPSDTAEVLRSVQVAVAPSVWVEPFGIVGLEAAASGCAVVIPHGTGLTEAAGPAGVMFRRGDHRDLSRALVGATTAVLDRAAVARHISNHTIEVQVAAYEAELLRLAS
jgi:glycosyltransferase involved in cell wall biosynthesis